LPVPRLLEGIPIPAEFQADLWLARLTEAPRGLLRSPKIGQGAERSCFMMELLKSFWTDESGQGLGEYALLIALIAVVLVTAITLFRNSIIAVFSKITGILTTAATS
jgi:pilus assembly protein Flp/PilA